jgi:hypothetical protein
LEEVDVALHGEDGEVAVEDLDGVVEDFVLDGLALLIFLDVFCVYFSLAL